MSKPSRRARRRARHDENVGILIGWCATEDDLAETRQGTHDALIKLMGDRRTGGVSWRQLTGDDAREALSMLTRGEMRPELLDHYRHLRAFLREYGGWLVIATAPGECP